MGNAHRTENERRIIYVGASMRELGEIFHMKESDVRRRVKGRVTPSETNDRTPKYPISEAAKFLVEPEFDLQELLSGMRPTDLPPKLQKAYWDGQAAREKYLLLKETLWDSQRVREAVFDAFGAIRMELLNLSDAVERQANMTKEQRQAITEVGDNMLERVKERVTEVFGERPSHDDEHGADPMEKTEDDDAWLE